MRRPATLIVVVVLAALAGLCLLLAGGAFLGWRLLRQTAPPVISSVPQVTAQGAPAPAVDRLVVQGGDSSIYTVLPDGTDPIGLTADASGSRIYRQPTWSPRADRVAWVEVAAEGGGIGSALLTSRPDGSDRTRAEMTGYAPFYLNWRPNGQGVACLSNWEGGLALRLVDVIGGTGVALLGQGSPLYFAWAPDGSRLLAHLDGARLVFLSPTGDEHLLADAPGAFNAPDWSRNGQRLVYALRSGNRLSQRLVVADPAGGVLQELKTIEGTVSFSLSPDGGQVAYVATELEMPTAAFGPLYVFDLASGEEQQVAAGPVLGFFWSPDGRRLAYLALGEEPPRGPQAALRPLKQTARSGLWLRWHVWDGQQDMMLGQFLPSDTFLLDYLRFVDQYARSMTPWAPDGRAVVYAGQGEDGAEGIWVQPTVAGESPRLVASGVYAAWSPR